MTAPTEHIMQFFNTEDVVGEDFYVALAFQRLAEQIVKTAPRNPERTVALRKLLESKDAAFRALSAKES